MIILLLLLLPIIGGSTFLDSRQVYIKQYLKQWSGDVPPPKAVNLASDRLDHIIEICQSVVAKQRELDSIDEAYSLAIELEMRREDIELLWTIHDFLSCALTISENGYTDNVEVLFSHPNIPFDIPEDLRVAINQLMRGDDLKFNEFSINRSFSLTRVLVAFAVVVFYGKLITANYYSNKRIRRK